MQRHCSNGPHAPYARLMADGVTHAQDSEPITAVAWSSDGGSVYTASRSLQQKRWDVGAGACRRSWKARVIMDSRC